MTKQTLLKVCVGVIVVLAVVGAYFYPKAAPVRVGAVSTNLTYNNDMGLAQVTLAPSSSSATSTSILNNGASDRYVTGITAICTGSTASYTSVAALTLQVATTSMAFPASGSTTAQLVNYNTNYVFNGTLATSTSYELTASTTGSVQTSSATGLFTSVAPYWAQGSYLTFQFNATNTASCSLTASWLPL